MYKKKYDKSSTSLYGDDQNCAVIHSVPYKSILSHQ